jgi:hypothetical protein
LNIQVLYQEKKLLVLEGFLQEGRKINANVSLVQTALTLIADGLVVFYENQKKQLVLKRN